MGGSKNNVRVQGSTMQWLSQVNIAYEWNILLVASGESIRASVNEF